jgi:hypothetical protein
MLKRVLVFLLLSGVAYAATLMYANPKRFYFGMVEEHQLIVYCADHTTPTVILPRKDAISAGVVVLCKGVGPQHPPASGGVIR